jgi:hypothetical protein
MYTEKKTKKTDRETEIQIWCNQYKIRPKETKKFRHEMILTINDERSKSTNILIVVFQLFRLL